jgi:ubiquinone/menaquinone biosynthesis C-methylase UbiE
LTRYAKDWNAYSQSWNAQFGRQYGYLGDEWNDDGTAERQRDTLYFRLYAERFLHPDSTVLEIGPGGGKWTVRIAPHVKKAIVLDVAEAMLKRTQDRCEALGIRNVEYVLGNGIDFRAVADESIDFFFSYDVFVHIALEDAWPYAQETARVLKPNGHGACHYAVNVNPQAWARIEQNNDWYRGGAHTLGQFYYHSPEALRRMYEQSGLVVQEQHVEDWNCTCVFHKPSPDIVTKLERILQQLITLEADDAQRRAELVGQLRGLPQQLERDLAPILVEIENEPNAYRRRLFMQLVRRLWRGF